MDKIHYYDGEIYRMLIDPNLSGLRQKIINNIKGCNKFIDIGCGTGALVMEASSVCKFAVGVDLSSKMIDLANRVKNERKLKNVEIFHGGVDVLNNFKDKEFDFVSFSMSLHEMEEEERIVLLNEALRIANRVIIADYLIPAQTLSSDLGVVLVEFIAGINHFKNYLNFRRHGGIKYLVKKTNANVISTEFYSTIFEIVVLSK
jgi:ubiquinone/menaquinone biosynthesis C-methylase UbiE